MKNLAKGLIISVAALGGSAIFLANGGQAAPLVSNSETQSQLYVSNCARCHGADGRGDTQLGREYDIPDLTTSRISSTRISQIIVKGDGDMPAFGKKLKRAQVNSLVKYVRTLRK